MGRRSPGAIVMVAAVVVHVEALDDGADPTFVAVVGADQHGFADRTSVVDRHLLDHLQDLAFGC